MTVTGTRISSGTPIFVEVHGLPDNNVKAFTYMASREVGIGELIQVPAPAWSIPVTGREVLPGFVLGESSEVIPLGQIRTIISAQPETPVQPAMKVLLQSWAETARRHEERAASLILEAQEQQDQANRIHGRMARVARRALGVH